MFFFRNTKTRKGFTLIELLIVVAIIAILAAIAVPNFLEAQVRAKVSRVKADMNTIATGMELYFVDNSTYPGHFERPGFYWGSPKWNGPHAGIALSTPIAYIMNAMMIDPFKVVDSGDPTRADQIYLNINSGSRKTGDNKVWPKSCYAILSFGPDMTDNTSMGNFPFGKVSGAAWAPEYDPSNGTKSGGEIWRCMPKAPIQWVDNTKNAGSDPFAY